METTREITLKGRPCTAKIAYNATRDGDTFGFIGYVNISEGSNHVAHYDLTRHTLQEIFEGCDIDALSAAEKSAKIQKVIDDAFAEADAILSSPDEIARLEAIMDEQELLAAMGLY